MMDVKISFDKSHQQYAVKPSGAECGKVKNAVTTSGSMSIETIAEMLTHGEVIRPAVCSGITADSFTGQQLFMTDHDNGGKIDGIFTPLPRHDIKSPDDVLHICGQNGLKPCFMYYTYSNGFYSGIDDDGEYEVPKFRTAFVFDEVITDKAIRDAVQKYLIKLFDDPDTSTGNADRLFFGTDTGECCYKDFDAVNDLSEFLERACIKAENSSDETMQLCALNDNNLRRQNYIKDIYSDDPESWDKIVNDALSCIPCSKIPYNNWLSVGTALKNENFDYSVWDQWSATDPGRYKAGECQKVWNSIGTIDINGGYIVYLAKQYGYQPPMNKTFFHRFKIKKDGEKYPVDIIDDKICNYILSENNIIIVAGQPYIYRQGVYALDKDGLKIKQMIKELIYQNLIKSSRIEGCYKLLISNPALHHESDELNKHPKEWINCKNGMYDAKDRKLYEHSPAYLSVNQIPMEYKQDEVDKNGTAYRFISSLIPDDDDREMFLQFCGLSLTIDTSQQKALILCGPGGTGKSTAINMLCNVIGSDNISALSLHNINERFYPACLMGKLLNACADIPSRKIDVADGIKKIIGEDLVMGEYKGGDVFWFRSYAKLLFSANTIPKVYDDKTDAYYRRLMILPIPSKAEHINNLPDKLYEDRHNFFQMILDALYRLYQTGELFESDHSKQQVKKLYMGSDTVYGFIEEMCEKDGSKRIRKTELYQAYCDYCQNEGMASLSAKNFKENLEDKGYVIRKRDGYDDVKGLTINNTKVISREWQDVSDNPFDRK